MLCQFQFAIGQCYSLATRESVHSPNAGLTDTKRGGEMEVRGRAGQFRCLNHGNFIFGSRKACATRAQATLYLYHLV